MEPEREAVRTPPMHLDDNDLMSCSEDTSSRNDSGIGLDSTGSDKDFGGYIHLFGRRYRDWVLARENCDRYLCPDDGIECERQDVQHHALTLLMEGKLHLAPLPLKSEIQVLDVCTGSGIWAIELGDNFPHWNVLGVDWSPMQPIWLPPNVCFELDDARKLPWCYPGGLDYIHTRGTIHTGCWKDFKAEAIEQAFECLRPGGWFESQEFGGLVECDDGTLPADSPLASWARILDRAGALKDQPRHVADSMVQWYREAGFVDVQCRFFKMPIGLWPKDQKLKEVGGYWQLSLELGLESLSLRLLHEAFGWNLPEITELLGRVKQDIRNRSFHAYTQVYVVYGRKPEPEELRPVDTCDNHPSTAGQEAVPSPTLPFPAKTVPRWSPTPEPSHHSLINSPGSDRRVHDDSSTSSNGGSSASSSLADDASNSDSSLFRHQHQDLVNYLVSQLCRYLDSKISETQLVRFASSWNTDNGSQQRGQQSQSSIRQERALKSNESGAAANTAADSGLSVPGPEGEEGNDNDNDGDGDERRRKRRRLSYSSSGERKRLACPYYKRNPRRYCTWTSCPGPGWDEIHRVKAHLYKRHALPLQCPRCWEPFRAESSYRQHLQQDPPCAVQVMQRNVLDGFTKEQEEQLRSRRRTRPDSGPADKWKEVYIILFPDDNVANIPSPYYEHTDDTSKINGKEDCTVFLRREMPAAARRELDLMFQDGLRDMEVALRPRIEQLMLDLQSRLLRTWMTLDDESGVDIGEPDEARDIEQDSAWEQERSDQDLVLMASADSQVTGYNTAPAILAIEHRTQALLPPPELDSTELDTTVVEQQEGLWDWDRDPSVSESADTLFPPDVFFDFCFEKLLDPGFDHSVEVLKGDGEVM